nr:hypothetical protein [Escherichia coli]
MNGDAIPSVARTISDISDRFSLADPLLIADIALNITNVLLSIRKQHKSMYNIGFLNLEVMVSLLFYINLTQQMLLKSRFLEFTNISAQLANIKEQRLSKVTFMIG